MNKHRVLHEGFTFTRNSANRKYTHAVLLRGSRAADRIECERGTREAYQMNLPYYSALANGVNDLWKKYPEQYPAEVIAADIARAKAWVELGEGGHVAAALASFDRSSHTLANDGDTYYSAAGWCGNLNLAAKLAGSNPRAIIVAVVP